MPLRDDLLTPIPGANPSGANLRYDPVYDKIKEARREEDDAPQGDWQRERKAADPALVIKLAGDALATRSKDLQLGAWLTEAALRREGFAGLRQGIDLQTGLLREFWDTVYPENEDGDLEMRAAPLEWMGAYLDAPLRNAPLTRSGLGYFKYKESRAIGTEEQANESDAKKTARETAIAEGKITAEEFDSAAAATTTEQYETWAADLDSALVSLEALNEICQEKFGDYAPGFSKTRTALEEVRQVVGSIMRQRSATLETETEAEPEPETASEPESFSVGSGGAAVAVKRAPAKRAVAGLEPADAEEATVRLAAIAKYLRQADGYNPAPYLMLRGYRWGELRAGGPTPDPALLVSPPTEVRQQIKRLANEANWQELLEMAETAMAEPCGRAWLDLQRYVVTACESYGYPAVAAAIRSELKALLADLPDLPQWSLDDDTPAANGETQTWLKAFATPAAPAATLAGFESDEQDSNGEEGASPDTFAMALERARAGRTDEAVELMAQDIVLQSSGRARFQRKLQLAQICMCGGQEALALPILEELAGVIDAHRLENWEASDAMAQVLVQLLRCREKTGSDADARQKLFARICRLDPVQALACAH